MSKENIAKIRESISKDEDIQSAVEPLLVGVEKSFKDMERKIESHEDTIHTVNEESKGRKEDKKTLNKTIEEQKDEIEGLKEKLENDDSATKIEKLETENEKLKTYKAGILGKRKERFLTTLKQIENHPDYAKAKIHLKFPEVKDDEKMDWTDFDVNVIDQNMTEIEKFIDIGLFKGVEITTIEKKPASRESNTPTDDEFSEFDED